MTKLGIGLSLTTSPFLSSSPPPPQTITAPFSSTSSIYVSHPTINSQQLPASPWSFAVTNKEFIKSNNYYGSSVSYNSYYGIGANDWNDKLVDAYVAYFENHFAFGTGWKFVGDHEQGDNWLYYIIASNSYSNSNNIPLNNWVGNEWDASNFLITTS